MWIFGHAQCETFGNALSHAGLTFQAGSGSDQYFTGKFTDEQLTWLGLHGCEVKGNVTKIVQDEALRKIKQCLAPLQLSKVTLEEVDIEQMFAEQVAEWVRTQKTAHKIR